MKSSYIELRNDNYTMVTLNSGTISRILDLVRFVEDIMITTMRSNISVYVDEYWSSDNKLYLVKEFYK